MSTETEEKPFKAFDWGTGQVDLTPHQKNPRNYLVELRPTEIHLKTNATLSNGPGFTIIMAIPDDVLPTLDPNQKVPVAYGQISLEMLNSALADIGYEVVKKES